MDVGQTLSSLSRDPSSDVHWLLVLVEMMRAEWHVSLRDALFRESVTAALALWPALMLRHGADPGLSAVDLARQRAKDQMRSWLEAHYQIA
jgi:hypothetical protein